MRWTFIDTKLRTQSHDSKYVGYDDSKMEFSASYSDGDTGNLVAVDGNNTHKSFCRRTECIGPGGTGKYPSLRIACKIPAH